MKLILILPLVTVIGCSSSKAQERCISSAQDAWRAEVADCADEGLSAEECGLNELTERRAENEKACVE